MCQPLVRSVGEVTSWSASSLGKPPSGTVHSIWLVVPSLFHDVDLRRPCPVLRQHPQRGPGAGPAGNAGHDLYVTVREIE